MRDDKGVDDKVVCIPEHDPNWKHVEKLEDLGEPLRDEISHFFSIYKQPEGIAVKVDGWFPREQAIEILKEAKVRFRDEGSKDEQPKDKVSADDVTHDDVARDDDEGDDEASSGAGPDEAGAHEAGASDD